MAMMTRNKEIKLYLQRDSEKFKAVSFCCGMATCS